MQFCQQWYVDKKCHEFRNVFVYFWIRQGFKYCSKTIDQSLVSASREAAKAEVEVVPISYDLALRVS